MFILIAEDNSIYQSDKISQDDKNACDEGFISIINTEDMTEYYDGRWSKIQRWE